MNKENNLFKNIVAIVVIVILASLAIITVANILHWLLPSIYDSPKAAMIVYNPYLLI